MKATRFLLVLSAALFLLLAETRPALASGTSWIPFMNKKPQPATTTVKKKATPKSSGTGKQKPGAVKRFFAGSKSLVTPKKKPTTIKPKTKTTDDTKPSGIKALFVKDTTPPPPPKSVKEWMALKQIKPGSNQ